MSRPGFVKGTQRKWFGQAFVCVDMGEKQTVEVLALFSPADWMCLFGNVAPYLIRSLQADFKARLVQVQGMSMPFGQNLFTSKCDVHRKFVKGWFSCFRLFHYLVTVNI